MNLEIKKLASKTMLETADWVEKKNTTGAGDRWLDKPHGLSVDQ
jgi:hypothetical protein